MIKDLKRKARQEILVSEHLMSMDLVEANELARKLKRSSSEKDKSIRLLELRARLEDLTVYPVKMEKVVRKKKTKVYTYWYASWRNDKKVKNVYIGSASAMNYHEALIRARTLKAMFLGVDL
ncbi:MAG: hypothetical protein EHM14_15480 [Methanothrix sp.]|nr:MAG: hypothetical protein EHM14_15480 [Methanothrix sp.]